MITATPLRGSRMSQGTCPCDSLAAMRTSGHRMAPMPARSLRIDVLLCFAAVCTGSGTDPGFPRRAISGSRFSRLPAHRRKGRKHLTVPQQSFLLTGLQGLCRPALLPPWASLPPSAHTRHQGLSDRALRLFRYPSLLLCHPDSTFQG